MLIVASFEFSYRLYRLHHIKYIAGTERGGGRIGFIKKN